MLPAGATHRAGPPPGAGAVRALQLSLGVAAHLGHAPALRAGVLMCRSAGAPPPCASVLASWP